MEYVVGIDIGGQTSKIGTVTREGEILSRKVIRSDSYGTNFEAYIDALAAAVRECVAESGLEGTQPVGVGVGAPNANHFTGEISYAANLLWAAGRTVDFAGILSQKLGGWKVNITNDANAAAVGEHCYGVARGIDDFIMLTLGTGVGSGIFIGGRLVYGHDSFAGELGHVCVDRGSDRSCGCGKKGCLETYCSATGVARTAAAWLAQSAEPSLLRQAGKLSSKAVYDAAAAGDAMALRIFDYTGTILGHTIADFVAFSAPEAIVFFGGLARAKEFLLPPVQKAMEDNLMPLWRGKVKILFSSLKESDAAILGASALAWNE